MRAAIDVTPHRDIDLKNGFQILRLKFISYLRIVGIDDVLVRAAAFESNNGAVHLLQRIGDKSVAE